MLYVFYVLKEIFRKIIRNLFFLRKIQSYYMLFKNEVY
ncbi:hypothetical protein RIEPE_0115 [Candidatus Riesia pediculicola USDA]|uniref:Uncharacterized protein n=1 Tax=Riesia pediculicola (strain USDA) TaxID=515618 RepID=D4G7S6_RIEPU|nr:hypothetical protein RIEPE_0115 [Candidatus Riesia pediculicola USDA]